MDYLKVYRIKLDTMGARMNTEGLKNDQMKLVIIDAMKEIEIEKRLIAQGTILLLEFLLNTNS